MTKLVVTGKIHFFDRNSNEGLVKLEDKSNVYFHGNSIKRDNNLKDGDKVAVEILIDTTFRQVTKLVNTQDMDALQIHNQLRALNGKVAGE